MNLKLLQKLRYSPLVMIASPLLALSLGGVGWASVSIPGVTNFVEIDGFIRFAGILGVCEDGSGGDAGATCSLSTGLKSNGQPCSGTCVAFDWANGPPSAGACSTSTTGVVTCPGTHGLFNGGRFRGRSANPDPATFIATDPTIAAHAFVVDPLGIKTAEGGACACVPPTCAVPSGSANPCDPSVPTNNPDCLPGETCVNCGVGDPTVYTSVGSETNGDVIDDETFATGVVPNKDDISNVYAIAQQDPNPTTFSSTNINQIFTGFERVVNNGDSHVDLEFLQAKTTLVPGSKPSAFPCVGDFQGHRSGGDLLLSVDFTTGGTFGSSTLRKWVCHDGTKICIGGTNEGTSCTSDATCTGMGRCIGCDPQAVAKGLVPPSYDLFPTSVCNGTLTPCTSSSQCGPGGICGTLVKQSVNGPPFCTPTATNTCSIDCGGWACRNADGSQALYCAGGANIDKPCTVATQATDCPGSTCRSRVLPNEFYEAGIDLAATGFTGCISSFRPHTRSSQSFTAVLKDFALVQFNTCRPEIAVTKSCSAAVNSGGTGVNVTFSGQVTNSGTVVLSNIVLSDNPSATFDSPCTNGTTSAPCCTSSTTLQPGASCSYSGTYPAGTCSPSDTVTVTATGGFGSGTATNTAGASCTAACVPRISVTKTCSEALMCPANGTPTVTVSFSGQVCACSSITAGACASGTNSDLQLTNVTVSDDQGGITSPSSGNIGTLAPGACANYSGSYASTVCTNTDTVTTTATAAVTGATLSPTQCGTGNSCQQSCTANP